MTVTQSELRTLPPMPHQYSKGCGYGLKVVIKPIYSGKNDEVCGGGKYFVGRYKNQEINIGTFGNKSGEYSLDSAMKKWMKIKSYCIDNTSSLKDYKVFIQSNKVARSIITLDHAVSSFLKDATDIKQTTHKEYTAKLNNQILNIIDGATDIKKLEWERGGRNIVENAIAKICNGNKYDLAHRCRQLLSQVFDYSIDKGWMGRGQNPAKQSSKNRNRHQVQHHPSITWDEVPSLIDAINTNACNSHVQTVMATKMMLMTFLRTGALARLQWEWINEEDMLLTIPGSTSGLKRNKGVNENIPHHIPITSEIEKLLGRASRYSSGEKYIFSPIRQNRYPHLDPASPNNYLRNLGYKGKQRAHSWRTIARTVGVEELKVSPHIIKRQMGHLSSDKLDKAYDRSQQLNERRDFLNKWCSLLVEKGLEI